LVPGVLKNAFLKHPEPIKTIMLHRIQEKLTAKLVVVVVSVRPSLSY